MKLINKILIMDNEKKKNRFSHNAENKAIRNMIT